MRVDVIVEVSKPSLNPSRAFLRDSFGSAPEDRTCAFKWETALIFHNWHL